MFKVLSSNLGLAAAGGMLFLLSAQIGSDVMGDELQISAQSEEICRNTELSARYMAERVKALPPGKWPDDLAILSEKSRARLEGYRASPLTPEQIGAEVRQACRWVEYRKAQESLKAPL